MDHRDVAVDVDHRFRTLPTHRHARVGLPLGGALLKEGSPGIVPDYRSPNPASGALGGRERNGGGPVRHGTTFLYRGTGIRAYYGEFGHAADPGPPHAGGRTEAPRGAPRGEGPRVPGPELLRVLGHDHRQPRGPGGPEAVLPAPRRGPAPLDVGDDAAPEREGLAHLLLAAEPGGDPEGLRRGKRDRGRGARLRQPARGRLGPRHGSGESFSFKTSLSSLSRVGEPFEDVSDIVHPIVVRVT